LRVINDDLKRVWISDRKIGKNFSIDRNLSQLNSVHKLGIGQAMLAHARIDPLYPQRTKIPLPRTAIAISVLQVLLDALDCCPEGVFRPSARSLRRLDNFSVPGVFRYAPANPCHCRPFLAYPEIMPLHDLSVARRHDLSAPIGPLHFLRPTAQHMIEVGAGKADFALCGQAKTLFGTALILELGHLAIPDM
jgi:hypothetical protein